MTKSIFSKFSVAGLGLLGSVIFTPVSMAQNAGIELGILRCTVEGGVGLILGSARDMVCKFDPANSDVKETYAGRIAKFGLDIGVTGESFVRWVVVAAQDDVVRPGALAGTYGGASASGSFAAGLGANVLVGGSGKSIALQPVSVQAQTGVNLAVGVSRLTLTLAK